MSASTEKDTKSVAVPATIITGVLIAVVVGVAYVFFGPDAAKAVCSALL